MKHAVHRTSAAVRDIVENAIRLGEQRAGLENRFIDAVEESLERILSMPEIGGLYETQNPRLQGIRVWRVRRFKNYLIFYRATAAGIEVIRLLHGARDIAALIGDE
jgi:toxin ParE1/3/4